MRSLAAMIFALSLSSCLAMPRNELGDVMMPDEQIALQEKTRAEYHAQWLKQQTVSKKWSTPLTSGSYPSLPPSSSPEPSSGVDPTPDPTPTPGPDEEETLCQCYSSIGGKGEAHCEQSGDFTDANSCEAESICHWGPSELTTCTMMISPMPHPPPPSPSPSPSPTFPPGTPTGPGWYLGAECAAHTVEPLHRTRSHIVCTW
jgi:hypothetical protein